MRRRRNGEIPRFDVGASTVLFPNIPVVVRGRKHDRMWGWMYRVEAADGIVSRPYAAGEWMAEVDLDAPGAPRGGPIAYARPHAGPPPVAYAKPYSGPPAVAVRVEARAGRFYIIGTDRWFSTREKAEAAAAKVRSNPTEPMIYTVTTARGGVYRVRAASILVTRAFCEKRGYLPCVLRNELTGKVTRVAPSGVLYGVRGNRRAR